MPTGLTHGVQEGKVTTLQEFALNCAKQFGACIMMRDEPGTATITRNAITENTDYHRKEYEDAVVAKKELEAKSPDALNFIFEGHVEDRTKVILERLVEISEQMVRYNNMLIKVNNWEPPTDDHINLKKYMIKQLEDSIEWDDMTESYEKELVELKALTFASWSEDGIESAKHSIEYHEKGMSEVDDRNDNRTEWTEQLFKSLGLELKYE